MGARGAPVPVPCLGGGAKSAPPLWSANGLCSPGPGVCMRIRLRQGPPGARVKRVIGNTHVCTGCGSCEGQGLCRGGAQRLAPSKGQSGAPPLCALPREAEGGAGLGMGDLSAGGGVTLSSPLVCAVDTDCRVQPHPCERKTLETVRELVGSGLCWRGSRGTDGVLAAPCPFFRFVLWSGVQAQGHGLGVGGGPQGQVLGSCGVWRSAELGGAGTEHQGIGKVIDSPPGCPG